MITSASGGGGGGGGGSIGPDGTSSPYTWSVGSSTSSAIAAAEDKFSARGSGILSADNKTSNWNANSTMSVELFNATFFQDATGSNSPVEAMELVHNISDKKISGAKVNRVEKAIWIHVSSAIAVLVFTRPICDQFNSTSPAKPAVCCTVHVIAEDYLFGFCTLEEFLPMSLASVSNSVTTSTRQLNWGTSRTYSDGNTVYIDLLSAQCQKPRIDNSLCSQYVS